MWTTSNSPANYYAGKKSLVILGIIITLFSQAACVSVRGSDAPKKAREVKEFEQPPIMDRTHLTRAVGLANFTLQKMDPDNKFMTKLAGPEFLKKAQQPIVIEVMAAEPFPPSVGTSSPVIEINGVQLTDTVIHPENNKILLAFLPDTKLLKSGRNVITVAWLGNEDATRTRKPLILDYKGTID